MHIFPCLKTPHPYGFVALHWQQTTIIPSHFIITADFADVKSWSNFRALPLCLSPGIFSSELVALASKHWTGAWTLAFEKLRSKTFALPDVGRRDVSERWVVADEKPTGGSRRDGVVEGAGFGEFFVTAPPNARLFCLPLPGRSIAGAPEHELAEQVSLRLERAKTIPEEPGTHIFVGHTSKARLPFTVFGLLWTGSGSELFAASACCLAAVVIHFIAFRADTPNFFSGFLTTGLAILDTSFSVIELLLQLSPASVELNFDKAFPRGIGLPVTETNKKVLRISQQALLVSNIQIFLMFFFATSKQLQLLLIYVKLAFLICGETGKQAIFRHWHGFQNSKYDGDFPLKADFESNKSNVMHLTVYPLRHPFLQKTYTRHIYRNVRLLPSVEFLQKRINFFRTRLFDGELEHKCSKLRLLQRRNNLVTKISLPCLLVVLVKLVLSLFLGGKPPASDSVEGEWVGVAARLPKTGTYFPCAVFGNRSSKVSRVTLEGASTATAALRRIWVLPENIFQVRPRNPCKNAWKNQSSCWLCQFF